MDSDVEVDTVAEIKLGRDAKKAKWAFSQYIPRVAVNTKGEPTWKWQCKWCSCVESKYNILRSTDLLVENFALHLAPQNVSVTKTRPLSSLHQATLLHMQGLVGHFHNPNPLNHGARARQHLITKNSTPQPPQRGSMPSGS